MTLDKLTFIEKTLNSSGSAIKITIPTVMGSSYHDQLRQNVVEGIMMLMRDGVSLHGHKGVKEGFEVAYLNRYFGNVNPQVMAWLKSGIDTVVGKALVSTLADVHIPHYS